MRGQRFADYVIVKEEPILEIRAAIFLKSCKSRTVYEYSITLFKKSALVAEEPLQQGHSTSKPRQIPGTKTLSRNLRLSSF
jgi:hypothetical protein